MLDVISVDDAESFFELIDANRQIFSQWVTWVNPITSVEQARRFIIHFGSLNGFQVGIWHENSLVGRIGVHSIQWESGRANVGYLLAELYQGRGIVTRAVSRVVRYLFEELGLTRIEMHIATENSRSRAVAEHLGFQLEGILRMSEKLYGKWIDHALYSCVNESA